MDDDLSVRKAIASVFRSWDYEVSLAADGQEAIDCYVSAKAQDKAFDFVIFDLINPGGMGGPCALGELRKIDPTLYAIAMSGITNHPAILNPEKFGFSATLTKPFDADELKRVLPGVTAT